MSDAEAEQAQREELGVDEALPAVFEQLRDALVAYNEESAAPLLLSSLINAVWTSSEAVSELVTHLRRLFALLPSTSGSAEVAFGQEIAGVAAEDLVLPPGPVSALQELILDSYDVAYLLLADHATTEAKTAESAVLAKKKEADKARLEAEEAVRVAGKSKSTEDQARVAPLREKSSQVAEELLAARQEQNRTRLDAGSTPHTARLRALTQFLAGLQDLLPMPLVKVRVDPPALVTAGLVDAMQTKLDTRAKTQKYYKQQYFNLLREETEGYAKLVVELLSNMGPPHDPHTGVPSESLSTCRARAQVVMNNIKSLIGYFDLHPHRALDIVLDVFSVHVIDHHVFFRQLLALSPWAEQGRREEAAKGAEPADVQGSRQIAAILGFKLAFYQAPEGPTEVPYRLYFMAAILIWDGLVTMLDIYSHLSLSEETLKAAQDKQSQASKGKSKSRMNALAMAGALDGGRPSAAAAASPEKAASTSDAPKKDLPNQKVALASALCNIGDLQSAIFIISRYPYLINAHPNIADDLLRMADHIIEPAYRELPLVWRRASDDVSMEAKETDTAGQRRPRWSNSEKKLVQPPSPRPALSAYAFRMSTPEAPLVFFWPEWKDRLPQPTTPQQAIDEVLGLMRYIGVLGARNLRFFNKLIRIGAEAVRRAIEQGDDATKLLWRDILRKHILPGVSLAEPNTGLASALWHLLGQYSYEERFSMYGEWSSVTYLSSSTLRDRQAEADHEAKNILKRISSDNIRQSARAMAKIAHSNPCIFFHNAINQIQSYQNMIGPVVESARYLSEVGQDVITYILLENLSRDKDRTKADGTNTADWLLNLADFVGQLFRRYDMRLEPILRYVLAQVQQDNAQDLVIFRSLVSDMTEIKVIDPLTVSDDQVRLLAGSNLLRSHVMTSLVTEAQTAVPDRKVNTKALRRWQSQVVSSDFCQQLVVRIALCRQSCIDRLSEPEASQVQSIASIYDQTHLVLLQLADYLEMHHLDSYEQAVPALWDLFERFGIEAPLAFHLARPVIRKEMANLPAAVAKWEDTARLQGDLDTLRLKVQAARAAAKKDASTTDAEATSAVAVNGDDAKEEGEAPTSPIEPAEGAEPTSQTDSPKDADVEMTSEEVVDAPPANGINGDTTKEETVEDVITESRGEEDADDTIINGDDTAANIEEDAMAVDLREKEEELIKHEEQPSGPDLREPYLEWLKRYMRFDGGHTPLWYLTFWELKLYDILAPTSGYTALIKSLTNVGPGLKNQLAELENRAKLPPVGINEQQRKEYAANLKRDIGKLKGAPARITERLPRIKKDEKEQVGHVARVMARLEQEKGEWVVPGKVTSFSRFLIAQCVRFRAPLSPVDALYCGHLVLLLHRIGTPEFNLMWTCEQIFSDSLTAITASFTEQEARNYAFFLSVIFGAMRKWALGSEATYIKEAIGEGEQKLPGLLETTKQTGAAVKHWTHNRFSRCVFKYEDKLRNTLKICLTGPTEHARNALRILIQLIDVFPIHSNVGDELESLARDLTSKDQAIKVLAEGYIAALNKRRPTWAKPFSAAATSLSAKAPAFTPTSKTPEPVERSQVSTPKPPEVEKPAVAVNGTAAEDKMEDVKTESGTSSQPLNLPPRPVVDPNWREKEAEKKAALADVPASSQTRPGPPSRQPSEVSRRDADAETNHLPLRPAEPASDTRQSRSSRDAERRREQEKGSMMAPRDARPRDVSRNERDGPMNPPPTGPRGVPASPRRDDVRGNGDATASPRAPRADREKAGEVIEPVVKRPSRPGTPDSAHSSQHRSERRPSNRDDTPVEGRTSDREHRSRRDREHDSDRERSSKRRSDRKDDGHRSERRHRDKDGRREHGESSRHRDSDRDSHDRRRAPGSDKRSADDGPEPSAKRRRTESPARGEGSSARPARDDGRRDGSTRDDEPSSSRPRDEPPKRDHEPSRDTRDGTDSPAATGWSLRGARNTHKPGDALAQGSQPRQPVRDMLHSNLREAAEGRGSRDRQPSGGRRDHRSASGGNKRR